MASLSARHSTMPRNVNHENPNGFGQESQISRRSKQTYGNKHFAKLLLAISSGTTSSVYRLKQSLGSWLNGPNQRWTHYYDTKRNYLLSSVSGSSGSLHQLYKDSSRPKHQSKTFATESVLSNNIEITKDHVPADMEAMNCGASCFLWNVLQTSSTHRLAS
jgi:hypothetical protein